MHSISVTEQAVAGEFMDVQESMTWRGRNVKRLNRILRSVGIQIVKARSSQEYLLRGYQDITRDDFTFRCDPHHPRFWTAFQNHQWEPETFSILRRFLTPRSVYYDIGAWIGPTVLYASKLCASVFAFEPDPVAYAYLLDNVTKNRLTNVRAFNLAVAATERIALIRSLGETLGDSMSSLLPHPGRAAAWPVTTVTIDTLVTHLSCTPPDFVKIDIEGGEFELIPAARNYLRRWRPVLYLSLHSPLLPAEEREQSLHALAAALDCYSYVVARYEQQSQDERAPFALKTLPASPFRDEFGSLLLLPDTPKSVGV